MRKYSISLMLCTGVLFTANAQKIASNLNSKEIGVQWGLVENSYKGMPKYLSAFVFTNTSTKEIPAKGWSIYFNLPRGIDTTFEQKDFKVEHINGDLNRIKPTANFKGIAPGQSVRFEMIANDWSLNSADAPSGLYLVFDNEPNKGIPLTNYKILPSTEIRQLTRTAGDILPVSTADVVYNTNKAIADIQAEKLIKIFPTPVDYQEKPGSFNLKSDVTIVTDPAFKKDAAYLSAELQKVVGKKPIISPAAKTNSIQLRLGNMANEAYQLNVGTEGIVITAATSIGMFYGIQSLKSLLPAQSWAFVQKSIAVPAVEVKDAPRFAWRAFMLDVARNFQPKSEILKTLDLLALYKINVFHFHLTEDEGWRIEIPGLPELTEIGGKRGHRDFDKAQLPPSFGSGPDNNSSGSGYYTKADFIEILKYATERHIRVIPEIEGPGHARAAIISMQVRYDRLLKAGKKEEAENYLLRAINDKSEHHSVQGWNDNVMDVSMPSTYKFLAKVVDELVLMYKEAGAQLETIHMGGDEVPAGSWAKSPAFAKIKQENSAIKTTDDLWYYFYENVNQLLKTYNLYLYGWEEVGLRKTRVDAQKITIPNPDFANQNIHLDVWNNVIGWGSEDLAYKLANAGYKVVLSPVSNLYFDMSYTKSFDEQGYYWGGFVDVDKLFSFIPLDYLKNMKQDRMGNKLPATFQNDKEKLTDVGKSNIVGIQGLLFSETITSTERMEYMILPKLLGLAERAWAKNPEWATEKDEVKAESLYSQSWSQFINVVSKRELPRLNYYAGGFKYRIPTPGVIAENGTVKANVQLPGFAIRYTTNGLTPTVKSPLYKGPITEKGSIKLSVFDGIGRSSRVEEIKNN
ncbi:family 20 glycosylhydrolase [Solitalea koreensis]|uniref:beta-N-acetylhexosaminidase n=1 Tax=Solitalea koreensis TaxID=543615 RepID=A0A521B1L3_9SPHI|nr:family 20 glycosylhydrolase [Solitalea koreensis]SMO40921.1 hexosaminidase [Solitalea koreensis]